MKKKSPDLQFYAIFFAEDKYNYPRLSIFVRKDEGEAVPTILNDITVTVGNSGFIRLDFYGRKGSDHKQFSFDSSSYSPEQVVQKTLCLIAENDQI